MATDALIGGGGCLESLTPATLERLERVLPPTWSRGNPVDIIGDAPAERAALTTLLDAPETDAVLLIHAPAASVPSAEIARSSVAIAVRTHRTLLSCRMGADSIAEAERTFREAGVPYATPEEAVLAFLQLVEYRRNQDLLMETPPAEPGDARHDHSAACRVIEAPLEEGRAILTEPESQALLEAYGIPVVPGRHRAGCDEALAVARAIGYPVVLKIVSPDISHKSDVGGVALNLKTEAELAAACSAMLRPCAELRPHARLTGFHNTKDARADPRARAHRRLGK